MCWSVSLATVDPIRDAVVQILGWLSSFVESNFFSINSLSMRESLPKLAPTGDTISVGVRLCVSQLLVLLAVDDGHPDGTIGVSHNVR